MVVVRLRLRRVSKSAKPELMEELEKSPEEHKEDAMEADEEEQNEKEEEEDEEEKRKYMEAEALEHKNEGNAKYKAGDYHGAIDCYTRAIDTMPSNAAFYTTRAAAEMMAGRSSRAVADCEKAVAIDSTNIKAYLRLGKAHLARKRCRGDKGMPTLRSENGSTNATGLDQKQEARKQQREERAVSCLKEGNVSMATSLVNAALRSSPSPFRSAYLGRNFLSRVAISPPRITCQISLCGSSQGTLNCSTRARKFSFTKRTFLRLFATFNEIFQSDPDNSKAAKDIKLIRKLERTKEAGNAAFKSGRYQETCDKYEACLALDSGLGACCAKLHCNKAATLLKRLASQKKLWLTAMRRSSLTDRTARHICAVRLPSGGWVAKKI